MKKIVSLVLVLVMLASLFVACAGTNEPAQADGTTAADADANNENTAGRENTAASGDARRTLTILCFLAHMQQHFPDGCDLLLRIIRLDPSLVRDFLCQCEKNLITVVLESALKT